MFSHERIYLDNAATSWPKPEAVYTAVDRYQRQNGAPAGRGTYQEAIDVERAIARARAGIARLLGVDEPRRIVFAANGTAALNLAIHGLLRPGDHVVTTDIEHNSVLRPLRALEERGTIGVARVGCDAQGYVRAADVEAAMTSQTRLIAVSHASNVTGAVQPVAEIGRLAKQNGARLLVDAAQTLGHARVSAAEIGADLIAASGHKGLLGPLGTGFLYLAPGMEELLSATIQGGTGTASQSDWQPDSLPDKFEAGNLNVPGLVGLAAAVEFIQAEGEDSLERQLAELTRQFWDGIASIAGVRPLGPSPGAARIGVVSLTVDGYDPQELAGMLDAAFGVQVRAGLHCAPHIHRHLGTFDGGTVRFSFGPFNTSAHVEFAIAAMREIAAARPPAVVSGGPLRDVRSTSGQGIKTK